MELNIKVEEAKIITENKEDGDMNAHGSECDDKDYIEDSENESKTRLKSNKHQTS